MSKGKWRTIVPRKIVPTKIDIAWSAGFIEGDGHIGRNKTTSDIEVTQKNICVLLKLQFLWGGSLGKIHKQGFTRNRTYFKWRVSGPSARRMALSMRRYLSPVKQLQVDFCLGKVTRAKYLRKREKI